MERAMYKPDEVANVMGVDPATVRNMCKRGEIPYRKAGRAYRIPVWWLEEWKNCGNELQA